MTERLKGLFITHNYGLYGASQSLQLLLKSQNEIDATFIIPRKRILSRQEKEKISQRFGVEVSKIERFFLPWVNCFECRKTDFRSGIIIGLKNLLWKSNQSLFYRFLSSGKFDFIHLNSIVLCEMISNEYPFIIHIRELLIDCYKEVLNQVHQAKGIIFIDESVVNPFSPLVNKNRIVLSNPVDMRSCEKHMQRNNPFDRQVIISMIGRIEEDKGVEFVIKAFKLTRGTQLRLLIVGDKGDGTHGGYMKRCKEIASEDPRILFWGEEKEICKIYAWSDYVIRGEIEFRMGRSILEALYSDCNVIIPCSDSLIVSTNCELNRFKNKVYHYFPRKMESLQNVFSKLPTKKIFKSNFTSNVDGYVNDFNRFIRVAIA